MATQQSPSYESASSLADLYQKTATTVKTGIKLTAEEGQLLRMMPRENIAYSPNESRFPVVLDYPLPPAMISEFGYLAQLTTQAPTSGTFSMAEMSYRFSYSNLAQAIDRRAKAAQIERQTAFQAAQAAAGMGQAAALGVYGTSAGTIAVVAATGSAGTTQTDIQLKNGFGWSLVAGSTTASKTQISAMIPKGAQMALIRSGSLVEFGTVAASPAASAGVGYVDITFASSVTPTANDVLVFASAVTDSTIAGTDVNNWTTGAADVFNGSTLHGIDPSAYPNWTEGYNNTSVGGHLTFAVKEAIINGIANHAGVAPNRFLVGQGVMRDAIQTEISNGRRYNAGEAVTLEGELDGSRYFTSRLVPNDMLIAYYDQAFTKVDLSQQPTDGMGPDVFKIVDVPDRAGVAAQYEWFHAQLCTSRAAFGVAAGLTTA